MNSEQVTIAEIVVPSTPWIFRLCPVNQRLGIFVFGVMMFFGVAPDLMDKIPLGMTPLIGIAVIGVGIMILTRRPGN